MANLQKFETELKRLLRTRDILPDRLEMINRVCANVEGMCDELTLAMLNMAVGECLLEDENYLEVGTWKGRSVITALQSNQARATVIDPLTFDDSSTVFYENIKNNGVEDRVSMFQMPWQDYIANEDPVTNVGVYLYDGDHGTNASYDGLTGFLPFLAKESILIVDDTQMPPVREDMNRWCDNYKDNIVFRYEVPFWMGQTVIGYVK